MKMTEITIETNRTTIISPLQGPTWAWCSECAEQVSMMSPEEVVLRTHHDSRTIYRLVETGMLHFREGQSGFVLICSKSVGRVMGNPGSVVSYQQTFSSGWHDAKGVCDIVAEQDQYGKPDPESPQPSGDLTEESSQGAAVHESLPPGARRSEMTQGAFDSLLAYLDKDWERAGNKYEMIRRKLLKFFECRGCSSPEDYADETINRVAAKIERGAEVYTADPASFFYGFARNVLKDYWRHCGREPLPLERVEGVGISSQSPDELQERESNRQEAEQRLRCLELSLQDLPAECRELIINYYKDHNGNKIEHRKLLAERLGLKLNALRIRVHRIKKKLAQRINDRLLEGC